MLGALSIFSSSNKVSTVTVFPLICKTNLEMQFCKGDNVVVFGTRYDGCFGTVVSRAATNGWYKVKVATATIAAKLVVLRETSLFPELPTVTTEKSTLSFIEMLECNTDYSLETMDFARALGIPYAAVS